MQWDLEKTDITNKERLIEKCRKDSDITTRNKNKDMNHSEGIK
jgi:hypothetical protein